MTELQSRRMYERPKFRCRALPLFLPPILLVSGCFSEKDTPRPPAAGLNGTQAGRELSQQSLIRVERFCGDCHPLPLPSTFPKDSWEEEVVQGFDFYIASKRNDLDEPSREETIRYFVDRAPDKVIVPRADEMPVSPASVKFQRAELDLPVLDQPVSYSHLVVDQATQSLLTADMRGGDIRRWKWDDTGKWSSEILGNGRNSCRLSRCDWNGDGQEDWLVGEIGTFGVADHHVGRVSILINDGKGGFQKIVLADSLARVVEAQPIDYDRDGDLDVIVAEFGWLETGSLLLLRNPGSDPLQPTLQVERIDARHGALGVQVVDVNQDGFDDYVTAYGQEFESVEVHFGQEDGTYRGQTVLALPDPSYNASSFQVVDLDGDGRLDILHTNGDTLDAFIAKPYHGVRWLKNLGDNAWETRELGLLVGALQATTADFDGDGDLDIVAVALFPTANLAGPGAFDSIVWWEQQPNAEFVRHSIERDNCDYTTCGVADINGDGRMDVLVGGWSTAPGEKSIRAYLNLPTQ